MSSSHCPSSSSSTPRAQRKLRQPTPLLMCSCAFGQSFGEFSLSELQSSTSMASLIGDGERKDQRQRTRKTQSAREERGRKDEIEVGKRESKMIGRRG